MLRRDKTAQDKKEHLDHIRIPDHLHSTQRNDDRKNGEAKHAYGKIDTGDTAHREGAQIEDGSKVHHDVQE